MCAGIKKSYAFLYPNTGSSYSTVRSTYAILSSLFFYHRDQHSQGIIHRALCELKLSKSGCQSKDFPTSVDTMTPPLPRKTKKRVRVIGDDIHLFTANAAIKLSPLLGKNRNKPELFFLVS